MPHGSFWLKGSILWPPVPGRIETRSKARWRRIAIGHGAAGGGRAGAVSRNRGNTIVVGTGRPAWRRRRRRSHGRRTWRWRDDARRGLGRWISPCSSAQDLIELFLVKVGQGWNTAASVFSKDLDQTCDEEFLLPVTLGFPVVGLAQSHEKTVVASPCAIVRGDIGARVRLDC